MAKPVTTTWSTEQVQKEFQLDLKNRNFAAFLAWLVPGLGHIYQGRTGKGALFFICIVGAFLFGMYVGDGHVAYASTASFPRAFVVDRWPFLCQAGIGAAALPALVERNRELRGEGPLLGGWFHPPRRQSPEGFKSIDSANNVVVHPDEFAKWNYDNGFMFDLGTVYTIVAGLLNILAIYDAHAGPLIITPVEPETPDEFKKK